MGCSSSLPDKRRALFVPLVFNHRDWSEAFAPRASAIFPQWASALFFAPITEAGLRATRKCILIVLVANAADATGKRRMPDAASR